MRYLLLLIVTAVLAIACKNKNQTAETGGAKNTVTEMSQEPEPTKQEQKGTVKDDGKKPFEYSKEVMWFSLEEVMEMQQAIPKPIMVDVYTDWCGPCKMLTKNTFGDVRVAQYLNEHFYCVKFNAESPDSLVFKGVTYKNPEFNPNAVGRNSPHQFTRSLNVTGYPTLFFFDKEANAIGPVVGYKTPAQLEIYLHYFAEEKFKTVQTQEQWQEYERNFVVTWN